MNPYMLLAGVVALALAVGGAGYKGYDYGYTKKEAEDAVQQKAANDVLTRLSVENAKLNEQVLEATQQKQEEKVRTIVWYRNKLVALPSRNCGWTQPERVLLTSSYCAAFPAAPDCVHQPLPTAAVPATQPDGNGKAAVGK